MFGVVAPVIEQWPAGTCTMTERHVGNSHVLAPDQLKQSGNKQPRLPAPFPLGHFCGSLWHHHKILAMNQ